MPSDGRRVAARVRAHRLLRCICEASTLVDLFIFGHAAPFCDLNGTVSPAAEQVDANGNGLPDVLRDEYADGRPPGGYQAVVRVATALQFYVFVFLEDGQGLLTFALFALQQSLPVPSPLSGSPFRRRSSSHRWRRHHVPGILSDERLPRRDSNMTLDSTSSPAMVRYNGVPSHNSYASFLGEGSPLPLLRRRHEGVAAMGERPVSGCEAWAPLEFDP